MSAAACCDLCGDYPGARRYLCLGCAARVHLHGTHKEREEHKREKARKDERDMKRAAS